MPPPGSHVYAFKPFWGSVKIHDFLSWISQDTYKTSVNMCKDQWTTPFTYLLVTYAAELPYSLNIWRVKIFAVCEKPQKFLTLKFCLPLFNTVILLSTKILFMKLQNLQIHKIFLPQKY